MPPVTSCARFANSAEIFGVPADGCASYRTLYTGLEELESDLHQHIHLENNILFPRAAKLEDDLFTSR